MILEPIQRPELTDKTKSAYEQFERLILEIKKKKLPEEIELVINKHITQLNSITDTDKTLRNEIRKEQSKLLVCWPRS